MAASREFTSTRKPRGSSAYHRDSMTRRGNVRKHFDPVSINVVHGMALQASDHDRLMLGLQDARAFAELLNRAHAGTGGANQIRLQNGSRRALQIAGRNLL